MGSEGLTAMPANAPASILSAREKLGGKVSYLTLGVRHVYSYSCSLQRGHTRTPLLGLRQGWRPCPSIGIGETLEDSQNGGCGLPDGKLRTKITDDLGLTMWIWGWEIKARMSWMSFVCKFILSKVILSSYVCMMHRPADLDPQTACENPLPFLPSNCILATSLIV